MQATSEVVETVEAAVDEVVGATEMSTNNADEVAETMTDDGTVAADTAAGNMTMASETTTPCVTEEPAVSTGSVARSTETDMSEVVKTPEAVSDATLSKIFGGGERMDTSGDHVAAAAQVIAAGTGDNPEAPLPAPSNMPIPSTLTMRLVGKTPLVPHRSTR